MQTVYRNVDFIFSLSGETVTKPTWGKDQPNNYNGEQNCVVLDGGRSWLWNDVGCNLDYLHWICQYRECHLNRYISIILFPACANFISNAEFLKSTNNNQNSNS